MWICSSMLYTLQISLRNFWKFWHFILVHNGSPLTLLYLDEALITHKVWIWLTSVILIWNTLLWLCIFNEIVKKYFQLLQWHIKILLLIFLINSHSVTYLILFHLPSCLSTGCLHPDFPTKIYTCSQASLS